jgi:hypothetical protein
VGAHDIQGLGADGSGGPKDHDVARSRHVVHCFIRAPLHPAGAIRPLRRMTPTPTLGA